MDWQPIKTAPRDGTPIEVWADGMMSSVMRWNPEFLGPISETPGCWVEVDGPCVWSEGEDCGPTHWKPVISPTVERVMSQFESALARRRAYGPQSTH